MPSLPKWRLKVNFSEVYAFPGYFLLLFVHIKLAASLEADDATFLSVRTEPPFYRMPP